MDCWLFLPFVVDLQLTFPLTLSLIGQRKKIHWNLVHGRCTIITTSLAHYEQSQYVKIPVNVTIPTCASNVKQRFLMLHSIVEPAQNRKNLISFSSSSLRKHPSWCWSHPLPWKGLSIFCWLVCPVKKLRDEPQNSTILDQWATKDLHRLSTM